MNQSEANDKKPTTAEAAWDRLQKQLELEPVNSQWVRWSKQAKEKSNSTTSFEPNSIEADKGQVIPEIHASSMNDNYETNAALALDEAKARRRGFKFSWMKRNRKWLSGITAASVLAITLFTPVGNQALAAILSKFRMEQVTIVQQEDIQQLMNTVFQDGQTRDAANKFGEFTHSSGTINGEYSLQEAEKLLNRKIILPKDIDLTKDKLYISPSSEISLTLHVDEVNKVLQRLGAKKLLPTSIDGKPVKLQYGETVNVSKQFILNGINRYYSFSQMTAPMVEVDPSIPVEEAMDAVLQFPFLPDNLKESLRNSTALNDGHLPMPVITNGIAEKHTVEGTEVVITQQKYNMKPSENGVATEVIYYGLTWVKDGQLYSINGNGFADQNALIAIAKELILQ